MATSSLSITDFPLQKLFVFSRKSDEITPASEPGFAAPAIPVAIWDGPSAAVPSALQGLLLVQRWGLSRLIVSDMGLVQQKHKELLLPSYLETDH